VALSFRDLATSNIEDFTIFRQAMKLLSSRLMNLRRVWILLYTSRIRQRVEREAVIGRTQQWLCYSSVLPNPLSKYAILKTEGDMIAET
jgi:hypothetical protein